MRLLAKHDPTLNETTATDVAAIREKQRLSKPKRKASLPYVVADHGLFAVANRYRARVLPPQRKTTARMTKGNSGS